MGSEQATEADRGFFRALLDADVEALDGLLEDRFLIVDVGTGGVTDRGAFLDAVGRREVRFHEIDTFDDEAIVREAGECAVVLGRTRMRVTMPDGSEIAAASRYTHLYVPDPDGGGLRLLSAQGTPIAS